MNYAALVDPTMGVGRGNCLIGPYRPLGMVRLGPDCELPHRSTTGYTPGAPVIGFSHTRMAGTGGVGRYGNLRLMPFTGPVRCNDVCPFFQVPFDRHSEARLTGERAEVGYYAARQPHFGVDLELTSTAHVGVHRYRFPADADAQLHFDAGATVQKLTLIPGELSLFENWEQGPESIGGFLEQIDDHTLRGRSDLRGGWGHSMPYSLYFQLEFDQPIRHTRFANRGGVVPGGVLKLVAGPGCLAVLDFGAVAELNVRVGISQVSIANAEHYLRTESDGRSFDRIRAESVEEWNRIFARCELEGGTETRRRIFYTMLYRLYCNPVDLGVDQENPFWQSGRRAFNDYCCLWDSVRNANSYFTLFDPELARDLLNNLLDIAAHTGGWLPDAYLAGHHAYMQSACAADIIFSEAARKHLTGVDYHRALQFLRRNSEVPSPDPLVVGRYLEDWEQLGYLSTNVPKGCISRHLEYAFYDWCIARLAEWLGESETAACYDRKAQRVWALWDERDRVFLARTPEGEFVRDFDPWRSSPECYNDKLCYESPAVAWTMNVFHDFPGLIARLGGAEGFRERLDWLFDSGVWFLKETMMHLPHLYTLIGRPELSAERVLAELEKNYRLEPDGLRDDEDFGCHSSWYLWNSVGLYPLIGHDLYLLTPPLFDRMRLRTGTGTLRIAVDRSRGSRHIAGIELNGRKLNRAWLRHGELTGEVELTFRLTDGETDFGRSELPFPEL